jgi:hypothetical protein
VATCIADILLAIDTGLLPDQDPAPADVAAALGETCNVLRRLTSDGVDPYGQRTLGIAANGLATICKYTADMFPQEPGLVAALVGVAGDMVGVLQSQLGHADRWATVVRLADAVRHCAAIIAESGPYDHIAELGALERSASNARRLGAANPPEPERCRGLIRPIPGLASDRLPRHSETVLECTAIVLDGLNRRGGDPFSVRQMLAACRFSEAVGRISREAAPELGGADLSDLWLAVGRQLVLIDDGLRPTGSERVLSACTRGFEAAVRLQQTGHDSWVAIDSANLSRAVALAPDIAASLEEVVVRRRPGLFVPVGQRPLREERVGEFLQKKPFAVERDDLKPVLGALETVERAAASVARREVLATVWPAALEGPSLSL